MRCCLLHRCRLMLLTRMRVTQDHVDLRVPEPSMAASVTRSTPDSAASVAQVCLNE